MNNRSIPWYIGIILQNKILDVTIVSHIIFLTFHLVQPTVSVVNMNFLTSGVANLMQAIVPPKEGDNRQKM